MQSYKPSGTGAEPGQFAGDGPDPRDHRDGAARRVRQLHRLNLLAGARPTSVSRRGHRARTRTESATTPPSTDAGAMATAVRLDVGFAIGCDVTFQLNSGRFSSGNRTSGGSIETRRKIDSDALHTRAISASSFRALSCDASSPPHSTASSSALSMHASNERVVEVHAARVHHRGLDLQILAARISLLELADARRRPVDGRHAGDVWPSANNSSGSPATSQRRRPASCPLDRSCSSPPRNSRQVLNRWSQSKWLGILLVALLPVIVRREAAHRARSAGTASEGRAHRAAAKQAM